MRMKKKQNRQTNKQGNTCIHLYVYVCIVYVHVHTLDSLVRSSGKAFGSRRCAGLLSPYDTIETSGPSKVILSVAAGLCIPNNAKDSPPSSYEGGRVTKHMHEQVSVIPLKLKDADPV